MWKLRIGTFITTSLLCLGLSSAAWATRGGDRNSGDVWLDNVGQPAGPGHEMDPHLACSDINIWASGLADSSGSFTVDGWPPSGRQEVDYGPTSWNYSSSAGDPQVIAVINVQTLISTAQSHGDTAANQGFHFKLDFFQDPQKHKTFWVSCPPSSTGGGGGSTGGGGGSTGGGGGSTGGGGGSTGGGGGSTGGGGTPTGTGTAGTPPVTTSTASPVKTSVGAVTTSRPRKPTRKRRLVHPARHRKIHARHVKTIKVAAPPFTG